MRSIVVCLVACVALLIGTTAHAQNYTGVEVCSGCHADSTIGGLQYTQWVGTKHAHAYDSVLAIQNNAACLPCHTTGWDTTLANGGFDDFYLAQPRDTIGMASMKNVQCESCHGPVDLSTNHGQPSTINPTAERCATCHQGEHHPYYEEWRTAKHAISDTNASAFLTNSFRNDPNCSGCHTYQGFLQYVLDTTMSPNVTPPGDAALPIVCAACHNPHSAANIHQLRMQPVALCQKCHNPEYDPDSPVLGSEVHHSTAFMLEGKGAYHFAGYTYQSSPHKDVATDKCVTCHIVMVPSTGGAPASTGHSFYPKGVKCLECHADFDTTQTTFNYHNVQTQIESLLTMLGGRLSSASHADSATVNFLGAKFNYDFVEADGSRGVHNKLYAQGLLESALINFNPTGVKMTDPLVPATFALSQNYPNPFNPTTKIAVALPVRSEVRLVVYTITGDIVTTLMNGVYEPGRYEVTWNGSVASGIQVANGVYLYRLEANSFVQMKKMIFMK